MVKKLVITILVLIGIGFVGVSMFSEAIMRIALEPTMPFEESPEAPALDYADKNSWAAHPLLADMSDITPSGQDVIAADLAGADVFFIHPTSLFSNDSWNDTFEDEKAAAMVDYSIMPNQAGVFNGCCRVFAPRYRQATLYSFMGKDDNGAKALNFAYEDVLRAFDHFIEHESNGRPIVLAGHSQGTLHLIRLIEDRITGTKLKDRIVAIYAVGYRLPLEKVAEWEDLSLCSTATQTGCILAWDTVLERSNPDLNAGRGAYFNGEYRSVKGNEIACVNPVNWATGTTDRAEKEDHLGAAVVPSETGMAQMMSATSKNEEFLTFPALVAPRCKNGFLRVMETGAEQLDEAILPGGSLHLLDYNLFYFNVRKNVNDRVNAFPGK